MTGRGMTNAAVRQCIAGVVGVADHDGLPAHQVAIFALRCADTAALRLLKFKNAVLCGVGAEIAISAKQMALERLSGIVRRVRLRWHVVIDGWGWNGAVVVVPRVAIFRLSINQAATLSFGMIDAARVNLRARTMLLLHAGVLCAAEPRFIAPDRNEILVKWSGAIRLVCVAF